MIDSMVVGDETGPEGTPRVLLAQTKTLRTSIKSVASEACVITMFKCHSTLQTVSVLQPPALQLIPGLPLGDMSEIMEVRGISSPWTGTRQLGPMGYPLVKYNSEVFVWDSSRALGCLQCIIDPLSSEDLGAKSGFTLECPDPAVDPLCWVGMDLKEPMFVTKFAVAGSLLGNARPMGIWHLEGSTDKVAWTRVGTAWPQQWAHNRYGQRNTTYPFLDEDVASVAFGGMYQYYRVVSQTDRISTTPDLMRKLLSVQALQLWGAPGLMAPPCPDDWSLLAEELPLQMGTLADLSVFSAYWKPGTRIRMEWGAEENWNQWVEFLPSINPFIERPIPAFSEEGIETIMLEDVASSDEEFMRWIRNASPDSEGTMCIGNRDAWDTVWAIKDVGDNNHGDRGCNGAGFKGAGLFYSGGTDSGCFTGRKNLLDVKECNKVLGLRISIKCGVDRNYQPLYAPLIPTGMMTTSAPWAVDVVGCMECAMDENIFAYDKTDAIAMEQGFDLNCPGPNRAVGTSGGPCWFQVDFGVSHPVVITKFAVSGRSATSKPLGDWYLEASNDGKTWVTIGTAWSWQWTTSADSNVSFPFHDYQYARADSAGREFTLFRINATGTAANADPVRSVQNFGLWGYTKPFPQRKLMNAPRSPAATCLSGAVNLSAAQVQTFEGQNIEDRAMIIHKQRAETALRIEWFENFELVGEGLFAWTILVDELDCVNPSAEQGRSSAMFFNAHDQISHFGTSVVFYCSGIDQGQHLISVRRETPDGGVGGAHYPPNYPRRKGVLVVKELPEGRVTGDLGMQRKKGFVTQHGVNYIVEKDITLSAPHKLGFYKSHDRSLVRITWHDNFMCAGPLQTACRWEILIGGLSCKSPGALVMEMDSDAAEDNYRPLTFMGYCSGVPAGKYEISIREGPVPVLEGSEGHEQSTPMLGYGGLNFFTMEVEELEYGACYQAMPMAHEMGLTFSSKARRFSFFKPTGGKVLIRWFDNFECTLPHDGGSSRCSFVLKIDGQECLHHDLHATVGSSHHLPTTVVGVCVVRTGVHEITVHEDVLLGLSGGRDVQGELGWWSTTAVISVEDTMVDFCASEPCDVHALCSSTVGDYMCTCNIGYEGDGHTCTEKNECDSDVCHTQATCRNTVGSYECDCDFGYTGDGFECLPCSSIVIISNDGVCNDCNNASVCILGSCPVWSYWFRDDCYPCQDFTVDFGGTCAECTPGGCTKSSCPKGYTDIQGECGACSDIALSVGVCSLCDNMVECLGAACPQGYVFQGNDCVNMNECSQDVGPCDMHATCIDTPGSFICTCDVGFAGDGFTCLNCSNALPLSFGGLCVECETRDSRTTCGAGTCPAGTAFSDGDCIDSDECASDTTLPCDPDATCLNTAGSFECSCNPGFIGDGQSCTACPPGFVNLGHGTCHACDSNTYQDVAGSTQCKPCDPCGPGGYRDGCGAATPGMCRNCAMGQYKTTNSTAACNECAIGKYQPDVGLTSCLTCATGEYQDNMGQSNCESCGECDPAAERQSCGGSSPGECVFCPVGKLKRTSGSSACTNCAPGAYQNASGQSECMICPAGTYQNGEGKSMCKSCLHSHLECDYGTEVFNCGGAMSGECQACATGKHQGLKGRFTCKFCAAGKYQPFEGQAACQLCSLGTYGNDTGSTACESCPIGHYSSVLGRQSCFKCGTGTFQTTGGQSDCQKCEIGTFINSTGQSTCQTCGMGMYQDTTGKKSCQRCPPGTFAALMGSAMCTDCAPGYFQDVPGEVDCKQCETCDDDILRSFCGGASAGECIKTVDEPEVPTVPVVVNVTNATDTTPEVEFVDPCVSLPCNRNATCTADIHDGYGIGGKYPHICTCDKPGFIGDGYSSCSLCRDMIKLNLGGTCQLCSDASTCTWGECPPGTSFQDGDCQATDVCVLSPCSPWATCTDKGGGEVECICNSAWKGDGLSCIAHDQCVPSPCSSRAFCFNLPSGTACSCNTGYQGDGFTCTDVDECADADVCGMHALCSNTMGSHSCECAQGYVGDGHTCSPCSQEVSLLYGGVCNECKDIGGSDQWVIICLEATCGGGFEWSHETHECIDVDECQATPPPCDDNAYCVGTSPIGSYTCNCNEGYTGNGATCKISQASLHASVALYDTNFASGADKESMMQEAIATSLGVDLDRIDMRRVMGLHALSLSELKTMFGKHSKTLSGVQGSAPVTAYFGVTSSAAKQSDMNGKLGAIMSSGNLVSALSTKGVSVNSKKSWGTSLGVESSDCVGKWATCSSECKKVYEIEFAKEGEGLECPYTALTEKMCLQGEGDCPDVNECISLEKPCADKAFCTNLVGSHTCTCNSGYMGNGRLACIKCDVLYELKHGGTCLGCGEARCTEGVCPDGFEFKHGECVDINECRRGHHSCDANATCINTEGSYLCECKDTHSGDGFTCTECSKLVDMGGVGGRCHVCQDENTCTLGICLPGTTFMAGKCQSIDMCSAKTCGLNATCQTKDGHYTCICDPFFAGDGFECFRGTYAIDPDPAALRVMSEGAPGIEGALQLSASFVDDFVMQFGQTFMEILGGVSGMDTHFVLLLGVQEGIADHMLAPPAASAGALAFAQQASYPTMTVFFRIMCPQHTYLTPKRIRERVLESFVTGSLDQSLSAHGLDGLRVKLVGNIAITTICPSGCNGPEQGVCTKGGCHCKHGYGDVGCSNVMPGMTGHIPIVSHPRWHRNTTNRSSFNITADRKTIDGREAERQGARWRLPVRL